MELDVYFRDLFFSKVWGKHLWPMLGEIEGVEPSSLHVYLHLLSRGHHLQNLPGGVRSQDLGPVPQQVEPLHPCLRPDRQSRGVHQVLSPPRVAGRIMERRFNPWISQQIQDHLWELMRLYWRLDAVQSWAFRYFLNFFNNKNDFFAFYIKLMTYFCTSHIWKAHPQSN